MALELFSRKKTLSGVIANFTQAVTDLETIERESNKAADDLRDEINSLTIKESSERANVKSAAQIRDNIKANILAVSELEQDATA